MESLCMRAGRVGMTMVISADAVLELAVKWEQQSREPECEDGSDDPAAIEARSKSAGRREGVRKCAADVQTLLTLLIRSEEAEPQRAVANA